MSIPILVFPSSENDEVKTDGRQLVDMANEIHNATIGESLGGIVDRLDITSHQQITESLVLALKDINALRKSNRQDLA